MSSSMWSEQGRACRLGLSADGFHGPREMLHFLRGPLNGNKLRCAG